MSENVKAHAQMPWPFINLGQHQAKGKQELIGIYSLDLAIVQTKLTEIVPLIQKFTVS